MVEKAKEKEKKGLSDKTFVSSHGVASGRQQPAQAAGSHQLNA
jgi:hypothetical protein